MPLRLAFECFGAGPPVVILHGLFASGRNWHGLAKELSSRHRVVCVDLRNHGRSPWAASMDYAEMADDVRMLIQTERLQAPVVIGHGTGGKTAMALALISPKSVASLVAIDIAPVSYVERLRPFLSATRGIDLYSIGAGSHLLQQLAGKIPGNDAVAALLRELIEREEHFDWRMNLPGIAASVATIAGFPPELLLRSYAGPSMLIHGQDSELVRATDLSGLDEPFPALQIVGIAGAGHWVHVDRPAEFRSALELTLAVTAAQ